MSFFILNFIRSLTFSTETSSEAPQLVHVLSEESLQDKVPEGELLEDWPCRSFSNASDVSISSQGGSREVKVTFSKYLKVRIYNEPTSQEYYSREDQREFQRRADREASRIKKLLSNCPQGRHGCTATFYLIERNLLSTEELLGLEDLIMTPSWAMTTSDERRRHTALVLKKQRELINGDKLDVDQLAKFSISRSSRNLETARLRGALAAPNIFDQSSF